MCTLQGARPETRELRLFYKQKPDVTLQDEGVRGSKREGGKKFETPRGMLQGEKVSEKKATWHWI